MIQLNVSGTALGIDVGSTTAKVVLVRNGTVVYDCYERHYSQVRQKIVEILKRMEAKFGDDEIHVAVSGSAGLGLAESSGLPFVQEVFATGEIVRRIEPETDVVVELGGEDAKIIFFRGGTDERMNGSCAGGTGAFIDQMAVLLGVTPDELDALSLKQERIYPIASRCGVFAKTDIQPLLNQGASKADIAASIYQAVVNQTVAGLAQGRRIAGHVMFLGGPLYYNLSLRQRFMETLQLSPEHAVFPEYARISVALGAALYALEEKKTYTYQSLLRALEQSVQKRQTVTHLEPLFSTQEEYDSFCQRHQKATVPTRDIDSYAGDAWLGIDCGSTTTKVVLMSDDRSILYSYYASNRGNPVEVIREQLIAVREKCGERIHLRGGAVTGYGEELIRHAFHVDFGLVETMAHFTAARHFNPVVDFILDIGGQDIKCFRVRNGAIDSIMLNEACSSGCGSFVETFARSMGYEVAEFAKLGLFAKAPVDLGSRCTVFMNSSVKQVQKDGAPVEDISAGLSISVVKNAIYKVIRATTAAELGEHIVVQGGTFYNDAVLCSFERELGHPVIRPTIAGLMGAFGAALYAQKRQSEVSTIPSLSELQSFTHEAQAISCRGCGNHCRLTVNTFSDGGKYISGNQCERGIGGTAAASEIPDLYRVKQDLLSELKPEPGTRGRIGMPLALGMYELFPFWRAIFESLGFSVESSGFSSRKLYALGQYSIPSDTVCYPAKLMHGHIEELLSRGVDAIFYPCLTYNVDAADTDNHYNCPVVAYYSEVLAGNMESLQNTRFLYPYLNINQPSHLVQELYETLHGIWGDLKKSDLRRAVKAGYAAYDAYMQTICRAGEEAIAFARENHRRIMILAGRPYHADPLICHSIDRLAASLGFVVVSEDAIAHLARAPRVKVLNQWTYHSRLYAAAQYAVEHADTELVQLVSFGCGMDAITTDEVRAILEAGNKFYTQIKIDEITNLGAVRIRLRSLIGALEERANS